MNDGLGRRDFLKVAGAGAGLALVTGCLPGGGSGDDYPWPGPDDRAPRVRDGAFRVAVIGAGSWGAWSALWLRQMGAAVTLVDKYGPGNSRSTSGGETRGVRTSYGDRPHGPLWAKWGTEAIRRWNRWDEEWGGRTLLPRVFFNTGDLILRPAWDNYLENTKAAWDELGVAYEVLDPDEIGRRWSVFDLTGLEVGLYEPRAGVVRARRAVESVAKAFEWKGGEIVIAEARPRAATGGRMTAVPLSGGESLEADAFVFALGPWFPKVFPDLMGRRLRIPIGHTFYLGVPPGDDRWIHPNMPSYGLQGVTGWPALPPDHRGFRVRTGGRPEQDPDDGERWIDREHFERPLDFVAERFPGLAGAPVVETRACHYELTVDRNFIVDRHPGFENVWLAGGGSAESFKFGPWVGEYVARRVLGRETDAEADEGFRLEEMEFDALEEGDAD